METTVTLIVLLFAIVMFVWEKIPLSLTAMIAAVSLTVFGVLTPAQAFAGFVNSNVILFVAMFIVGGAFFETGMASKVGGVVTRFAKTERQLIVAVMMVVGLMSGVLSNTGTAAVLIPVVIGIAAKSGFARGRLLLPLVFAAAMGGNLTLIGAPGNLMGQTALQEIGMEFGFFTYGMVGLPMLIVGIIFFGLFGQKLLPSAKDNYPESSFDESKDFSDVPVWKQTLSWIILLATLLAMIFESQIGLPIHVSGSIGAILLVLTGVITEKQAFNSIDMKVIFLFGGSLALATALDNSGAGALIAHGVVDGLGHAASPFVLLAAIFILCAILTQFMSNTATTALMVPISMSIAEALGADPRAVIMATVIGGSMAYATPIGMPANTMVLSVGGYRFIDYVKAGLPLVVIVGIVALILLPILFPFFP